MLHAEFDSSFFDYSDNGLDGHACRLMLHKLDDPICARFLGNAMIGAEFTETTAAHVQRTYQTLERQLLSVLPDNDVTRATLERHKAMITVHDTSDIIREMIVASTETDPAQKAVIADALHAFDFAVTPFTYKLAMFAAHAKDDSLFNTTIDGIRSAVLKPDQFGRGLSMDEAITFSQETVKLITQCDKNFSRFGFWNHRRTNEKTARMMGYYNEIEQTTSFDGLQSQIHEKCDGTFYALHVHAQKIAQNMTPTLHHVASHATNRFNGRFEKNLFNLFQQAGTDRDKMLSALASINFCYDVSARTFQSAKDYVGLTPLHNEPDEFDAVTLHDAFNKNMELLYRDKALPNMLHKNDAADIYLSARDDFYTNGVLWLPQNGKTLFETAINPDLTIARVALPHHIRDAF